MSPLNSRRHGVSRLRFSLLLACWLDGAASADSVTFRTELTLPGLNEETATTSVASTVTLPGRLFDPPVIIEPGGIVPDEQDSPILASKALWEAFIADDEAAILAHWARADRRLIRTVLADAEVRELNRRMLQAHQRKEVFGFVEMTRDRRYGLLLVRYDGEPQKLGQVEAYVFERNAWRATNALVQDERFDVVWNAFRAGNVSTVEVREP